MTSESVIRRAMSRKRRRAYVRLTANNTSHLYSLTYLGSLYIEVFRRLYKRRQSQARTIWHRTRTQIGLSA